MQSGYVALPSESADDRHAVHTSIPDERATSPTQPLLAAHSPDAVYKTENDGVLTVSRGPDGVGHTYAYAYGPPGLAGLLHNSFALRSAVFASLGGLLFGYDQGVIANVLVMRDFLERWPVGPWEKGLMSELVLLLSAPLVSC